MKNRWPVNQSIDTNIFNIKTTHKDNQHLISLKQIMKTKLVDKGVIVKVDPEVWTLLSKAAAELHMTMDDYANSLLESYLSLEEDLELYGQRYNHKKIDNKY